MKRTFHITVDDSASPELQQAITDLLAVLRQEPHRLAAAQRATEGWMQLSLESVLELEKEQIERIHPLTAARLRRFIEYLKLLQ